MDACASKLRLDLRRLAYSALAAALLALLVILVDFWGAAWWLAVAFGVGPDLALLYGLAPRLERGQLHPRAVLLYNVLHRFWGPLVLAVVAPAAGFPEFLTGALAWTLHVVFDRAIGLGLRSPNGFLRPDGRGPTLPQWRHSKMTATGRHPLPLQKDVR